MLNDAHTTSLYNSITGSIIFPIPHTRINGDIGIINTVNRMRNRNSVVLLFRGYSFLNNVVIHYRPFGRPPDVLRVQKIPPVKDKIFNSAKFNYSVLDFVALRIRAFALRSI